MDKIGYINLVGIECRHCHKLLENFKLTVFKENHDFNCPHCKKTVFSKSKVNYIYQIIRSFDKLAHEKQLISRRFRVRANFTIFKGALATVLFCNCTTKRQMTAAQQIVNILHEQFCK